MVTQYPISKWFSQDEFWGFKRYIIYDDLIGKKDNEKKSAKRPTDGTVTVKGLRNITSQVIAS